jgi:hypothetical protein
MLCDGTRIFAQAGVEGGLSATGLLAGKVRVNAETVENVYYGFTSFREDRIDKTKTRLT